MKKVYSLFEGNFSGLKITEICNNFIFIFTLYSFLIKFLSKI